MDKRKKKQMNHVEEVKTCIHLITLSHITIFFNFLLCLLNFLVKIRILNRLFKLMKIKRKSLC